jgi:hypothetical protein
VVKSPFAAVRLRTGAAKRYKRVKNATAVIWKTLRVGLAHLVSTAVIDVVPGRPSVRACHG